MVDDVQLIRVFRKIRDARAAATSEYNKKDKEFSDQLATVQMALLQRFNNDPQLEAIRTTEGTAFKQKKTTPQCSDWSAFGKFIIETGDISFLHRRIATEAVVTYLKENGKAPPGVGVLQEWVIQVRKPTEKGTDDGAGNDNEQ